MDSLIFCTGFVMFFVVLFSFILMMRYLNYRETLALAEKGLVKPPRPNNGNGKAPLVWGILIAAVGLALTLGLWPLGFIRGGTAFPLGLGPWMLAGILPLFFGLALVLIYVLTRETKKPETETNAPPYTLTDAPVDMSIDASQAPPLVPDQAAEE